MKKLVSVFLVLMLLLSALPMGLFTITASAATTRTGTTGDCTWSLNGTVLTISGEGEMADYSYSSSAPWGNSITIVIVKEGVTSIGEFAFFNCTSLTSIIIPDSVTSIGSGAFYNSYSLTSISVDSDNQYYSSDNRGVLFNKDKTTLIWYPAGNSATEYVIPDSVTSIGEDAFSYCTSLTSIDIPDSVTSIGDYAFYYCTSLTNVNLGNGVTSIGYSAFYHCTSLTSITIPDSVISIDYDAFSNCTSLTSIDIPNSVTSIGGVTFYNCTSLTSIDIPNSVTSIGADTFSNCTSLTSITIPDSVTSIGIYAFYCCRSLTNVNLGNGVTSIDRYVFENCTSLTSITIPNSVTSIGKDAFRYCYSLKYVYYRGSKTQKSNITIGSYNSCLTNATWFYNSCIMSAEHTYSNNCDDTCDVCGDCTRIPPHKYDNNCDAECNGCGEVREVSSHNYEWVIDKHNNCGVDGAKHEECTVCHAKRNENTVIPATGKHTYDHGCDTDCNVCGETRVTSHKYSNNCDASCNVCGATRTAPHSYKTSVTKATTSKNGKIVKTCSGCKKKVTSTIYYAKSFSLSATSYTYNGKVQTPTVTVKDAKGKVIDPKYYTLSYSSGRKNVGTYKIKVTLKGIYSGSKTLSYKINPISISKCQVSISGTSYTYNGKTIKPSVKVQTAGGSTLKNGTHYTVSYSSGCKNPGTYKVTVKMKGCYSGSKTFTYKINPISISKCKVSISGTSYYYNGKVIKPSVKVQTASGSTLKNGTHYTVSYSSGCKNPGTYKVVVKMKGTYSGSKTFTYTIKPLIKISTCKVSLSGTNYTYNGKVITPSVKVVNAEGTTLKNGTHYTVTYSSGRKNIGTYKVVVKMKGIYTGSQTLTYKINPISISKCKVSISATSYTYDGKAKTPSITVKTLSGTTLKKDTHYTVSYSSGRINVGTYKVVVKMKGIYSGSQTFTFDILPPKTSITSLVENDKTVKVDFEKKTTQVTGYELQYATAADFTDALTMTIADYNTTSATITEFKAGATCYVRVRTYKTVNGVNYYSGWSTVQSINTTGFLPDNNAGWIPGWY